MYAQLLVSSHDSNSWLLVKWDPQRQDTVSFHQSAMLYIMYFFLRMETYRNGLATYPTSLEVCVNAAHSCIHIVEAHCKRDYLSLGPQMLVRLQSERGSREMKFNSQAAIANSGIVLLINIWKAKRLGLDLDIDLEMGDVVKCMLQLERFEQRLAFFWLFVLPTQMFCRIQLAGRLWYYNLLKNFRRSEILNLL